MKLNCHLFKDHRVLIANYEDNLKNCCMK